MSNAEVFHVMGTLHVIVDCTSSSTAKCLNGVNFTFLPGKEGKKIIYYAADMEWKMVVNVL